MTGLPWPAQAAVIVLGMAAAWLITAIIARLITQATDRALQRFASQGLELTYPVTDPVSAAQEACGDCPDCSWHYDNQSPGHRETVFEPCRVHDDMYWAVLGRWMGRTP